MMNLFGRVISYSFRFAMDIFKLNSNRIKNKVYSNIKKNSKFMRFCQFKEKFLLSWTNFK